MKLAQYRLYYSDHIEFSIASIVDHVDAVVVFWTDRPWKSGRSTTNPSVEWDGRHRTLPSQMARAAIERVLEYLTAEQLAKVVFIHDHVDQPQNQFTEQYNRHLRTMFGPREDPIQVHIMEGDLVWRVDQLEDWMMDCRDIPVGHYLSSSQIELWRSPGHTEYQKVPPTHRHHRTAAGCWVLPSGAPMPTTRLQGEPRDTNGPRSCAEVHNFGFAVSEQTMLWKHLSAIHFSRAIGDSDPNREWFARWKHWKPGDINLEISKGYEFHIPHVDDVYPREFLPEAMQR